MKGRSYKKGAKSKTKKTIKRKPIDWAEANERFFQETGGKVGIPKEVFYSGAHVSRKGSMKQEFRF